MSIRQVFGVAALAGSLAVWAVWSVGGSPVDQVQPAAGPAKYSPAALVGTASCSARGCHGALTPSSNPQDGHAVLQDEYSRWVVNDPHTKAYTVLFNPVSKQISRLLYGGDENAHKQARCLACHTNPSAAKPGNEPERFFGVGCEACHGNAQHWLKPHTGASWTRKDGDALGLANMTDTMAVARNCAGCHIGAPADPNHGDIVRDMNHDLIAAGHPRLMFEFSTYLANLPPHWNVKHSEKTPKSAAELWAKGQLASAQVALALLADRASRPAGVFPKDAHPAPWPEFAEYDCYACHHDLEGKSWRQERWQKEGGYGKTPGTTPFGTWYYPLVQRLAPEHQKLFDELDADMNRPLPKTVDAARTAKKLENALGSVKVDGLELRQRLLTWLTDPEPKKAMPQTWDAAEQLFLATCQILDWPVKDKALVTYRAFPEGQAKPGTALNSPRPDFRPKVLFDMLTKGLKK